jgi:hypothetical protein
MAERLYFAKDLEKLQYLDFIAIRYNNIDTLIFIDSINLLLQINLSFDKSGFIPDDVAKINIFKRWCS